MKDLSNYLTAINHWTNQYQSLLEILVDEQKALEKRDYPSLEALVSDKNTLVKEIAEAQSVISSPDSPKKLVNLVEIKTMALNTSELKPYWEKLMNLVAQCNQKNEVNSRLIELVTQSTKRTFNLIKGFDPDNNIYDAKGDRKVVKHVGQAVSA